jgi:hypothetical protein
MIADPSSMMNMDKSFSITMWVYIIDITGNHTLFCKQNPLANDPGIELCIKIDSKSFNMSVRINSKVEHIRIQGMVP